MRIEVTQEDIDNGIPEDCWRCPVARAVCRVLSASESDISVDGVNITHFLGPGDWIDYPTPQLVNEFIEAFDAKSTVIPFSFDIGDQ